jgi:hypothetical protein
MFLVSQFHAGSWCVLRFCREETLAAEIYALMRLMADERTYRHDNLTIGMLARKLKIPEYRLWRLINRLVYLVAVDDATACRSRNFTHNLRSNIPHAR